MLDELISPFFPSLSSSYEFSYDSLPWQYAAGGAVTYVLAVLVAQRALANSPPRRADWLFVAHNTFLCVLSAAMLIGVTRAVVRHYSADYNRSLFELYCDSKERMNRGALWWWVTVFYLSKFYEFLDTVFLLVRVSRRVYLVAMCSTVVFLCEFIEKTIDVSTCLSSCIDR